MNSKTIIEYKEESRNDSFRIYIKNGIVMNPETEELIKANSDILILNRIRQTNKGNRFLNPVFPEE